ncbi:MAG: hypothetical protein WCK39_00325 [Methanomassiliicoccales archaeon]
MNSEESHFVVREGTPEERKRRLREEGNMRVVPLGSDLSHDESLKRIIKKNEALLRELANR